MRVKRKKRKVIIAIMLGGILLLGYLTFRKNVTPAVIAISASTIKSMTTIAVNEAVYETLEDSVHYNDLVNIQHGEDGDVEAIMANSAKINKIARDTAYLSQKNLEAIGEQGIRIPIGTLTGSPVLAGFGPEIKVKIIPIGNVHCSFRSEFQTQGINQTRHAVYLQITAEIDLVMPTASTTVTSETEVLVCESLIVGKVPSTYLQSDIFGKGQDATSDK